MKYSVDEMIESQKGMVGDLLRSKTSFFRKKKKETIYNGFPIKYFDKKSYLEVVAEWFTSFPLYLSKEKLKSQEPLIRIKLVMEAVFSTIYRIVKPSKSFNPVLGETF